MSDVPAAPYVHHRRLHMGDTDAAAIAYTGRFPNFALEALESWWIDRIGTDWFQMLADEGVGTPFVHLSMDLRRPLTPRDLLASTVGLKQVGRSSLHFAVTGRALPDDAVSFEALFICVFSDLKTMRPMPIPERYAALFAREQEIYRATLAA